MQLVLLTLLAIIPINLSLGALILLRDRKLLSNIFFSTSILFLCVWALGDALLLYGSGKLSIVLGSRLFYIGPMFTALFLVLFSLNFHSQKQVKAGLLGAALSAVSVGLSVTIALQQTILVTDIQVTGEGRNVVVVNPKGWLLYTAYFSIYFVISYVVLIRKARRSGVVQKVQLEYVFAGVFITSIFASITNLALPLRGQTDYIWLGPLFTMLYVGITAMAILRHRLFDIRGFVLRAGVYSLTALILALLYVAPVIFIMLLVFDLKFHAKDFIVAVFIGTIASTNYNRLRQWFDRVTNKIFFRDAYDPTMLITELNKALVATIDLQHLLRDTANLLKHHMRPEYCCFVLKGVDKTSLRVVGESSIGARDFSTGQLERVLPHIAENIIITSLLSEEDSWIKTVLHDADIFAVARLSAGRGVRKEIIGYILLGQRKSGKGYNLQDAQVLDAVSNTLVIAMQNALHFEEIQHFNATLRSQVEEQTRKYRTANEKLKKLDETKDEFISMASHQLRTPLTSVKGYLSMVLEGDAGPLKPQQRELLKQSFMSSERMVNLIADLLNLSRLNTGKFVIDAAPVDLRVVVDQEVAQLRETAKAKNVKLIWVIPKTFTIMPLDEGKMHQVIMNFIDNALYYTPSGGNVEIILTETPTSVEYRVKDTGIGVPRDTQHRLFSKFYRADNARRMRPDGTGLGLYMAKKVIAAQGGSIIFESEEGKGSTFGFRFVKPAGSRAA